MRLANLTPLVRQVMLLDEEDAIDVIKQVLRASPDLDATVKWAKSGKPQAIERDAACFVARLLGQVR